MKVGLRSHSFLFEQVLDTLPHLHSCTMGRLTVTVAAVAEAFPSPICHGISVLREIPSRFQNSPSSCPTSISSHRRWCRNENNFSIMLVNLCTCAFCDFPLISLPQLIWDHLWCGSDQFRNAEPSWPAAPAAWNQERKFENIWNSARPGRREGKNKQEHYKHRLCLAWDQWKV